MLNHQVNEFEYGNPIPRVALTLNNRSVDKPTGVVVKAKRLDTKTESIEPRMGARYRPRYLPLHNLIQSHPGGDGRHFPFQPDFFSEK